MRWWTFLTAWVEHGDRPQVPEPQGLGNLAKCLVCPARVFSEVAERDFIEQAVHAMKEAQGKVTVWCGRPGRPDPKEQVCGCWVGVEAGCEETATALTYKGRRFVASMKTTEQGEECPRAYWAN